MSDEKQLQQKYMEFQMIEEQLKQISNQVQELDSKLLELEYLKKSLDELAGAKKGSEILAPISPGIFVKAELLDPNDLLVNVGSKTVVGKNIKETKKLLDFQINEIDNIREQMIAELTKNSRKAQDIEKELIKITGE